MERLTMPPGICQMASTEYCLSHKDCYSCEHGRKVFRSLAAYEDTGMEPEEIIALAKGTLKSATVDVGTKLYDLAVSNAFEKRYGITLDRMCELAEADRDGRCVVLPCKVGDTVYLVADGEVKETRLLAIKANVSDPTYSGNPSVIYEGYFQLGMHVMCWVIGNMLYLTRDSAEAALEAQK